MARDGLGVEARPGGRARAFVERSPVGGIGRDLERLLEERDRLLVRAERGGTVGGGPQGDTRLRGERVGLAPGLRRSRCAAR